MSNETFDRRTVLGGAAALAAGATLAACGSTSDAGATANSVATTTFAAIGAASIAPTNTSGPSSAAGAINTLGKADAVAVGGGVVYQAAKVVVTQPTAGNYKAFSAVCTHQGCIVSTISNGTIQCPCHGSAFSVKDGAVVNGPATEPLKEQKVTVIGGEVKLGS